MLMKTDHLRIRMLSYASRLLVQGLNNKATEDGSGHNLAQGIREVEIARELLEILNDTKENPSVRNRRNLPNR